MEVIICADPSEVGAVAGGIICSTVRAEPTCAIGLATGSTPLPTYRHIANEYEQGTVEFGGVSVFMLDEYVGLPAGDPQRYRSFLTHEIVDRLDIPDHRLHGPDVDADDVVEACATYERCLVDRGGIAIQLLGIGTDGHIGFNEPGSSLSSRTRMKTLHSDTVRDNARFFDAAHQVPRHVLTMGLGTILDARKALMIATGEAKADAVAAAVEGPVAAMCPASVLQLHRHAVVVVDEAAASRLAHGDYYRDVYVNKPEWQRL